MSDMADTQKDLTLADAQEEEVRLRLANLKTMQGELHREHLELRTQTIQRIAEDVTERLIEKKHFCTQEKTIGEMSSDIKSILRNQGEIKKGLEERFAKYESEQMTQGKQIAEIQNTIKLVKWAIGVISAVGAYLTIKRV